MNRNILMYIRKHKYIYDFLRDDSSHYKYLYQDNNYIKEIKRLAKEKYRLRYTDKLDNISNRIKLVTTLIDVSK